ncbi:formyltetrahydrofolate deformylase [Kineosphaera limosa]|uniref:Formyltetrahydrofolate deformylase n=1 Tax=Kineosphaera limosa NBRC 100340 TaxID=1184609 RepID=K6XDC1_9MICO|nr:formyltetrahydrofolate deformylase [Kineosphaera limosa]NYE00699.1 formyltetrahydrofolate deformylase [Kineosphaera limosa]GAB96789.1 formyltetrahydrofolate deformylase [Kineosphaera limosa NBRC 100340]
MTSPVPGAAAVAAVQSAARQRATAESQRVQANPEYVLVLSCEDRPGIVAGITAMLFEHGGNIEESQQFDDARSGLFFMRIRFSDPSGADPQQQVSVWRERTAPLARKFDMTWELWVATNPFRTLIMVSKAGHCLNDLLFRWQSGALNMTIPAIVSNHTDLEPLARAYGIPFHHIPITPETKDQAEAQLMDLVHEHKVHLVVLARYMQVLSDQLCQEMSGRIINIHHSFLPSFKGGRPYHQAFERGVKLVGATAHYVTADLDEGPIIEQDVTRVDHRMGPNDLVRAGQDVEADVLSRAVQWHCDSRVLLNTDRTVVFD